MREKKNHFFSVLFILLANKAVRTHWSQNISIRYITHGSTEGRGIA